MKGIFMAALFSFGILLVISVAVMVLATIIGLFANSRLIRAMLRNSFKLI